MKNLTTIFCFGYLGVVLAFSVKVYDHFFEAALPDKIALLLTLITSCFAFIRLSKKYEPNKWIIALLLLAMPFALYPLVYWFITFTNLGWLLAHLILMLSGSVFLIRISRSIFSIVPIISLVFVIPYDFKSGQKAYFDLVEVDRKTRKGNIQVVDWRDDTWVYYNQRLQYATTDQHMYQESFVQPVMHLVEKTPSILIIGGDNRIIEKELMKFKEIQELHVIPYDMEFYRFMVNDIEFPPSEVIDIHPFQHLNRSHGQYDVIFIDTPDPTNLEYLQFFTTEFYALCSASLRDSGYLVAQAGNPYENPSQFDIILKTIQGSFEYVLPYHAQIPSLGEWSWILGSKKYTPKEISKYLNQIDQRSETTWWDQEAMKMMMSFGKSGYFEENEGKIGINSIQDPILHQNPNNQPL